MPRRIALILGLVALLAGCAGAPKTGADPARIDNRVRTVSGAPAMGGQPTEIYVREVASRRSAGKPVVLFVHGAGTPAEVAFDVPYGDFSWMAYLARAGMDAFSMDQTGYGRSLRPDAMRDPCNLSKEQQTLYVPARLAATCNPGFPTAMTTPDSDWAEIDAVVDHLRRLRGVARVSLVGWSQGGPRAGGYAARHPEKVDRLVLLAPVYLADSPLGTPQPPPANAAPMTVQTASLFDANWQRQVGCADQYETATRDSVWSEMLASDPEGSRWTPAARRAPAVPIWGWNRTIVSGLKVPTLLVAGVHDKQIAPDMVRRLHADLGSETKVFVDLACSSHNAMWERNHLLLFKASLDWLKDGNVAGKASGELKLGY